MLHRSSPLRLEVAFSKEKAVPCMDATALFTARCRGMWNVVKSGFRLKGVAATTVCGTTTLLFQVPIIFSPVLATVMSTMNYR